MHIFNRGTLNAMYFKAATNCTASGNVIRAITGSGLRVGYNSVTGHKCQNITFTYNKIFATGAARAIYWGGASEDNGGGVCDYNTYSPKGTVKLGTIYGSADALATLAALRAAWAGYGDGSNDLHSRIYTNEANQVLLLTKGFKA
jgi:hypothetical protein